jgi:pyruvate,water dikinase
MHREYIYNLRGKGIPDSIGNKAQHLLFLIQKKFQIPETHVCIWAAYQDYLQKDPAISMIIGDELAKKIDLNKHYAIRSSANIEDNKAYSFAGQFKSILNITGRENIIKAIQSIWASADSKSVRSYLKRTGIDADGIRMAVIIQEMVTPIVSGVSFSKNPMTGFDEIIVEATRGGGDRLHQDGITPERWVHKWGRWAIAPDTISIDESIIQQVVGGTKEIAAAFGRSVDLEWVYDGVQINWVQLREITSLHSTVFYSNKFAREVLPGIIKPLVWSINVPLVCGAWIRFLNELVGVNDIQPFDLAKSFYYRAYFNMGTIGRIFELLGLPGNTIEVLMAVERNQAQKPSFRPTARTLKLIPRMLRCAFHKVRFKNELDAFLPAMRKQYASFPVHQLSTFSPRELVRDIERLHVLNEQTAYYMIITYLLMGLFYGLFKNQLKKYGVSLEDIDLTDVMEDLQDYDPNVQLDKLNRQFNRLDEGSRQTIAEGTYQDLLRTEGVDDFKKEVSEFMKHFGHLSESGNDFSSTAWRENPDAILNIITHYPQRDGNAPTGIRFDRMSLPRFKKMLLKPLYKKARTYRFYREAVGSLFTVGYGIFRSYFLAIGDQLTRTSVLAHRDDIFLLYFDEIKEIIDKETSDGDYGALIEKRRSEMKEYEDAILPAIIYGDQLPPLITPSDNILKGIAASKGIYTGGVKVIKGISDFRKLQEGDVLVIPFSDVGWTPLFPKAGAIISESGGFLSHSSIVAREYHIPAVVSVPGICKSSDGTLVTVDGYRGEISIHQPASETG